MMLDLVRQAQAGAIDRKDAAVTVLKIGVEALQNTRHYTTKSGDEYDIPLPERNTAMRAVEIADGILRDRKPATGEGEAGPGLTDAVLRRAGLRLVATGTEGGK